jgi:hypothetical protein
MALPASASSEEIRAGLGEGAALAAMGVKEGHFYTDNGLIPVANLAAMKAL